MAESYDITLVDFETGDRSQLTSVTSESGNTMTVDAASKNNGTYGGNLYFGGVSGSNQLYGEKIFSETTEIFARTYLNYQSSFVIGSNTMIPFSIKDGVGVVAMSCQVTVSSADVIYISRIYHQTDAGATFSSVSITAIAKNTWHYMEFRYKTAATGASDGIAEFRFNGVTLTSVSGLDNDTVRPDRALVGNSGPGVPATGSVMLLDDFKINNATSGYPGVYADAGAGTSASLSDLSYGIDSVYLIKNVFHVSESGTFADTINKILAILYSSDSGISSDNVPTMLANLYLSDTVYSSEALTIVKGGLVSVILSESGIGVDSVSVRAILGVSDTGSISDTEYEGANFTITENGVVVDSISVYALLSLVDSGISVDDITIPSAEKLINEYGYFIDSITVSGNVSTGEQIYFNSGITKNMNFNSSITKSLSFDSRLM